MKKNAQKNTWTKSMVGRMVYACTPCLTYMHKQCESKEVPHLCQAEVVSVEGTKGKQKILLRPINFVVPGEKELHSVRKCESWSESPVQVVLERIRQMLLWLAESCGERDIEPISVIGETEKSFKRNIAPSTAFNAYREHGQIYYCYQDVLLLASRIERYKMPILADRLYRYVLDVLESWNYEDTFARSIKEGLRLDDSDVLDAEKSFKDDLGVADLAEYIKKGKEDCPGRTYTYIPMEVYKHLQSKGLVWKLVVNKAMLDMNTKKVIVNSDKQMPGAEREKYAGRHSGEIRVGVLKVEAMPCGL